MIIAGTVSAYLKLSIDDFQKNLQSAVQLLGQSTLALGPVSAGLKGMELSARSASTVFKSMQQGVSSSFYSARNAAASACAGMTSTMSSTARQIKNGVLAPIRSLKAPLASAMRDAGSGMAVGLRSKTSSIVAVARSIASQTISTIRSALRIASPSKVMRQIGAYTVEGMALGLTDGIPRIADSSAAVARTVESGSSPVMSLYGPSAAPSSGGAASVRNESLSELVALSERMDRLLDYLYDTEPVLRLDGRTFGRMVREYS